MITDESRGYAFHFVSWPDTNPLPSLLENANSGRFSDIFISAVHEFAFWWMQDAPPSYRLQLEKALIKTNTRLHLLVGCMPPFEHLSKYPVENFYVHVWPMCWAYRIFHNHHFPVTGHKGGGRLSKLPTYNSEVPNTHFLYLNNKPKQHRAELLDYIHELDIDPINFSWLMNDIDSEYYFNFWYEKRVELDTYEGNTEVHQKWPSKAKLDSALEIVGETLPDNVYWTEKTFYAILHEKPFIINGGQFSNLRLQNYGFKLYDTVNYKFDLVEDPHKRVRLLARELRRLFDAKDPAGIHRECKDTASFNRQRLFEIVKNREFIPHWKDEWNLTWNDLELAGLDKIDTYV